MRTTLNLNDALLVRAKTAAAQQRTTLTRLIEEGLALRLDQHEAPEEEEPREPYRVRVFGDPNAPKISYEEYKARVAAMEHEDDLRRLGLLPPDDAV